MDDPAAKVSTWLISPTILKYIDASWQIWRRASNRRRLCATQTGRIERRATSELPANHSRRRWAVRSSAGSCGALRTEKNPTMVEHGGLEPYSTNSATATLRSTAIDLLNVRDQLQEPGAKHAGDSQLQRVVSVHFTRRATRAKNATV